MEIKELVSFFINESSETLEISPLRDLFEEDEEDDGFESLFDDDFEDPLDEDEIMSFLNEYYLIYPNKLPTAEFF